MRKAGKLTLKWTARTAVGTKSYALYSSTGKGRLKLLAEVIHPSATVKLKANQTYGFAVVATDLAGLTGRVPTKPAASVRVN